MTSHLRPMILGEILDRTISPSFLPLSCLSTMISGYGQEGFDIEMMMDRAGMDANAMIVPAISSVGAGESGERST